MWTRCKINNSNIGANDLKLIITITIYQNVLLLMEFLILVKVYQIQLSWTVGNNWKYFQTKQILMFTNMYFTVTKTYQNHQNLHRLRETNA